MYGVSKIVIIFKTGNTEIKTKRHGFLSAGSISKQRGWFDSNRMVGNGQAVKLA